jgi:ethanolamine ammonia-lyase small subunit
LSEFMRTVRARTPARILVGRAGPGYRTATQLELRQDHAVAVDAVHAEFNMERDFGTDFIRSWKLFEVVTCADSKSTHLVRPDLGRRLSGATVAEIERQCPKGVDLQVAIGDGLSAAAVTAQVPLLLPLLEEGARSRGWKFGRPFVIRHCRVGVLNDLGALLLPQVVVLLIGERPGLATALSLSAYMAYQPKIGNTDAQRNLISNIHQRGLAPLAAAQRILALAEKMLALKASGVAVKEEGLTGAYGEEPRCLPGGAKRPRVSRQ